MVKESNGLAHEGFSRNGDVSERRESRGGEVG